MRDYNGMRGPVPTPWGVYEWWDLRDFRARFDWFCDFLAWRRAR
jgi:hypothetical protein